MMPVVGASWAERVALWVATSARFLRLWRLLEDELLARFQIYVQEEYAGKGEHDDAHEKAINRGDGSVHDDTGDTCQRYQRQKDGKCNHHRRAPRSAGPATALRRSLFIFCPKFVAGAVDKNIFQRRFAHRNSLNLAREGFD